MGIFAIFAPKKSDVARSVYYGLYSLQHRGQESAGITVNDRGVFNSHKNKGLVGDVFTSDILDSLGEGNMALGHVRYGTLKNAGVENAEPLVVNHVKGHLAVACTGNLTNAMELRTALELRGSLFHTTSDSEIIAYQIITERLTAPSIEVAVSRAMKTLEGACSMVVMSPQKLVAARDAYGFHPLCYGRFEDGGWAIASETCALDAVGAEFVRDVEPGEVVVFDKNGPRSMKENCEQKPKALCVFEYIYTARPDSTVDGCSVHKARRRAGKYLAQAHPVDADIVIGVPDSGLDTAIGYSTESGIPYGIGFIKNKYIGRTFIAPGQSNREQLVRIKLNPVGDTVRGKRVVLIDDSIVRGTTSMRIVKLLRQAGATEIHMRVSAPPFLFPCYYGTDIDSKKALIANDHSVEEIRDIIGVDSLGYLTLEDAKRIAMEDGNSCGGFCTACFDGVYPGGVPTDPRKDRYNEKLSEEE